MDKGETMTRVYYAHCMSIYDTPKEKEDIRMLNEMGFRVINPNTEEHCKECEKYHDKMVYFCSLVRRCDCLAFRSIPSGEIPGGVWIEITHAKENLMPVFELPNFSLRKKLDKTETREYLKETGVRE